MEGTFKISIITFLEICSYFCCNGAGIAMCNKRTLFLVFRREGYYLVVQKS
jgi:hypothetical protein